MKRTDVSLRKLTRALAVLLILLWLLPGLAQERTVFLSQNSVPFAKDTPILAVYVCNLVGADSILLECGGQTVLVDCGTKHHVPQITDMLKSRDISHIDIIFNTHPHSDHIGGLAGLLEEFTVGAFYTVFPLEFYTPGAGEHQYAAVRRLNAHNVPIVQVTQDDEVPLGDAKAVVYHQPNAQSVNEQSGMLHVRFGERTILLAADVDSLAQTRFGERFDLKSDVLKYPHHGLNALNRPFLQSVQPELAIITHGMLGSECAQEQMKRHGIPYRFASWGVIELVTDGNTWQIDQPITGVYVKHAVKHGIPHEVPAE